MRCEEAGVVKRMPGKYDDIEGLAVTGLLRSSADVPVRNIVEQLRAGAVECRDWVIIENPDGQFLGSAQLSSLIGADVDLPLGHFTEPADNAVFLGDDRDDIAASAIKHELSDMPLLDQYRRCIGIIPAHEIMRVLHEEHFEDIGRMAGIIQSTDLSRSALESPPLQRVRRRLPGLLVGLIGSILAATLVAGFEQTLKAQIAVAYFIPALVYLADAVGTQTEAVAVRGLSVTRLGIGSILARELATGALLGAILALLGGAVVAMFFGGIELAQVIAISLLAACCLATVIGLLLPWVFLKAGWDPAFASGPLATVVQDVLTLVIYFWIATLLLV